MKLVIFDFDGVLIHTHTMCFEIHKELNPNLKYEFFQGLSHGNFWELYKKAENENKIIDNPDFQSIYNDRLSNLEMPSELKKVIIKISEKYPLFIVSSTSTGQILPFLKKELIADKFKLVLGGDVDTSKTVKIKRLLADYKISSKDAIFVTDTTGDIIEAQKCAVQSIGVTWGLHEKDTLLKEKTFALVDTPEELKEKIEEFFK